ncbi:MAG: TolC family protein [Verrucomicrobia bacterium]|nr:MAG: TolC family protein [Verrucomicrobiota bacterium]
MDITPLCLIGNSMQICPGILVKLPHPSRFIHGLVLYSIFQSVLSMPLACAKSDTNPFNALFGAEKSFPLSDHVGSFDQNRSYELSSLIELSLANNPYTRSAWFNALASSAAVGQAKAPYFPKLTFKAAGGYDSGYASVQDGPIYYQRTALSPTFNLEYLLLDFGRRSADVRNTIALLEAANLQFSRKVQSTVFAVQQSYFAHTASLIQRDAAVANLELAKTILAMVEDQKKVGLATQPELLVAQKTYTQAQFDMADAERNVLVTLGNVRTAVGLEANAPLKVSLTAAPPSLETISGKVDELINTAIARRPDLAAKIADIRASKASTDRALADFMPTVSLEGSYQNHTYNYSAQQGTNSGTFNGNHSYPSGFVVMSWDLFDGFERVEKVKKRQAEEAMARANAESTRLETTRDVWTDYNNSLKARKRVEYANSLLSSAKENFDSMEAAFKNGLATITELVSLQSALATARFEQAGAQADYLTSLASLSLAMGQFSVPSSAKVKPASL